MPVSAWQSNGSFEEPVHEPDLIGYAFLHPFARPEELDHRGSETRLKPFLKSDARAQRLGPGLYFTDLNRGTGGLAFALWHCPVAQLLANHTRAFLAEYHVDGFRYGEISTLLSCNLAGGWKFCRKITAYNRKLNLRAFHDAVLEIGAVPLPVLEEHLDAWIAGSGVGPYPEMESKRGWHGAKRSLVLRTDYGRVISTPNS